MKNLNSCTSSGDFTVVKSLLQLQHAVRWNILVLLQIKRFVADAYYCSSILSFFLVLSPRISMLHFPQLTYSFLAI